MRQRLRTFIKEKKDKAEKMGKKFDLTDIFKKIDKDKNGYLDQVEFEAFFNVMDIPFKSNELK